MCDEVGGQEREFVTMDGNTLDERDFDRMGEAYESGEWPEGVNVANVEPRQGSVTLPGWIVAGQKPAPRGRL